MTYSSVNLLESYSFPSVGMPAVTQTRIPPSKFRRVICSGVVSVRKRFKPFDDGLEFGVATEGLELPAGVEILIGVYASAFPTHRGCGRPG